jgi:hypothetical protein
MTVPFLCFTTAVKGISAELLDLKRYASMKKERGFSRRHAADIED